MLSSNDNTWQVSQSELDSLDSREASSIIIDGSHTDIASAALRMIEFLSAYADKPADLPSILSRYVDGDDDASGDLAQVVDEMIGNADHPEFHYFGIEDNSLFGYVESVGDVYETEIDDSIISAIYGKAL